MIGALLSRYLGRCVLLCTLLSWALLLALFTFFHFVEQLNDLGAGAYDLRLALYYTLLSMPRTGHELLPIAVVVGTMIGLGAMANNGELLAVCSAGVSRRALARSLLPAAAVLIVIHLLLGEWLAPGTKRHGIDIRDRAMSGRPADSRWVDFWMVDAAGRYINIRRVLPGQALEDIYIYEFDHDNRLQLSTHAARAHYRRGQWLLQDIRRTGFLSQQVGYQHITEAIWDVALEPGTVTWKDLPAHLLSLPEVWHRLSTHNDPRHVHILFAKLLEPVSIVLMLLLPLVVIRVEARRVSHLQRVGLGCIIGVSWHILRDIFSSLGIVYGAHPALGTVLPPVLLLAFILWRLGRIQG